MLGFAEHFFRLGKRDKQGVTLRAQLEQLAKSGVAEPVVNGVGLEGPEMPAELAHVWGWFLELNGGRQGGFAGPQALSYAEMDAWARMTGARPTAFEVEMLRGLDEAYLRVAAEEANGREG